MHTTRLKRTSLLFSAFSRVDLHVAGLEIHLLRGGGDDAFRRERMGDNDIIKSDERAAHLAGRVLVVSIFCIASILRA